MPIGVVVNTSQVPTATNIPTSTGTLFAVGVADQGTLAPVRCLSISDYTAQFGPRTATSATLYDGLDTYFHENGGPVYVGRVSGGSAAAAKITGDLLDAGGKGTISVTYKTAGIAGNNYQVSVAVAASKYTVNVLDVNGNVLEAHGPFPNASGNAPLLADTSSGLVNFAQSAATGFTTNAPVALAATALTGGLNPSGADIADANFVTTLANFPANLGPGQVAAPGKTTSTVWSGLITHALANNRFALLNLPDSPIAATQVASAATLTVTTAQAGYCHFNASSVTVPGTVPGTARTVTGDVVVAALCSQVAATGNDNQAPAGQSWPLQYVTGFTNTYIPTDINTLNAAGINTFSNRYGVLCLFGFSSYALPAADLIYWQASAGRERMALVAAANLIAEPFLFKILDGRNITISNFQGQLQGLIAAHWRTNALYGNQATDAGTVQVAPPVNTPATAALGQLNAIIQVRISPFAELVTISIAAVPITQTVSG